MHEERASASPDFIYLEGQIERTRELRERETLSLNEAVVKQEREDNRREEHEAENMRRALKGLELREWVDEEGEDEEDQTSTLLTDDTPALAENDEDVIDEEEYDPLILESGRILADFIALNHRRISAIGDIPIPR